MGLPQLTPAEAILLPRVLVALLLGALIGIEREMSEHPAGVRTMALVSLGAALYSGLGTLFTHNTDPTRIAAQVVTGVGFLGGGAILRHGTDVRGLTTAASVWVAAAVGMAVGFGFFYAAALGTVLSILALPAKNLVGRLAGWMGRRRDEPPRTASPE